ncbi:alpha/beta hydrolase [Streptomyces sp. NBC_00442]|uniref:alpha/beta fold hydrolase n=1 Tax=Streptomyces sp. NBC_00442 TaxID=2903651 RepID=UPI002E1C42B8
MSNAVVRAIEGLVPGGAAGGELPRGGRVLRWVEAGGGPVTVVLDAACGTSALTWAPIMPAVAERARVVAYDRAGLGMSDPAAPLTAATAVEDLIALLTHIGRGPCVLVGNSWGGLLAQWVAWAAPELVAGLVLVDPAHEEFQPRVLCWADGAFAHLAVARHVLGAAERSLRENAARAAVRVSDDPQVQELLIRAELDCHAHRHQARAAAVENRMTRKQMPALRRLRASSRLPDVPVVVLSATQGLPKGMRARWTSLQAEIAATAAQGEHVVVGDAGHFIHESRPEAVAKAVLGVVERTGRG